MLQMGRTYKRIDSFLLERAKKYTPEQMDLFWQLGKTASDCDGSIEAIDKYEILLGKFVKNVLETDNVDMLQSLLQHEPGLLFSKFKTNDLMMLPLDPVYDYEGLRTLGYSRDPRVVSMKARAEDLMYSLPIFYAAMECGALKCVQVLHECMKQDENTKSAKAQFETPVKKLYCAHGSILRADVYYLPQRPRALYYAIRSFEPKMVDFVLSKGADAKAAPYLLQVSQYESESSGRVFEHRFMFEKDKIAMMKSLLAHGANPYQTSKEYLLDGKPATPLEFAMHRGEKELIQVLEKASDDWAKKHPVRMATLRFLATFGQLLSGKTSTPQPVQHKDVCRVDNNSRQRS